MTKSPLHLMTDYRRLLRLYNSGEVFCAVDTETTGLRTATDRIIEIGAVKFSCSGIAGHFSTLINPGISVPPFITNLTHIDDSMLACQPDFHSVAESFLEFTKDTILIAHNAQFDLRFLNMELEKDQKSPLSNHAIDTLRLSRWAYPDNEKWTLQHLACQFNIDVHAAHRAEDDARVCMELFLQCLKDTKDRQKQ